MIQRIDELNEPPIIGKRYLVPHIFGPTISFKKLGTPPKHLWAVLLPSHEDSKYASKKRFVTKEINGKINVIEESYCDYKPDPNAQHHYHVDPRFTNESFYESEMAINDLFHTVVFDEDDGGVRWIESVCLRDMPIQSRLYTVFGEHFIDEFKNSSAKCYRCPHKGINLGSIPIKDGVITCPAHGLRFNSDTLKVIDI